MGAVRLVVAMMFPSPCGEKVGINAAKGAWESSLVLGVSVPLRGKGRDQPRISSRPSAPLCVSVPLRGKGRDQLVTRQSSTAGSTPTFPSPCGEKVGINTEPNGTRGGLCHPFPSPCGEKVGINTNLENALRWELNQTFPSPCGEKVGINLYHP